MGQMIKKEKKANGTKEWASHNANCIKGCSHKCKFCYASEMSVRFHRSTPEDWENEVVNLASLNKRFKKVDGQIMFPSSHDLTPQNLEHTMKFLGNILKPGNKVLIVTKPHFEVIKCICTLFQDYKDQILFRFTIGSINTETLKFWEPNAPSYEERKECLIYAFSNGFQTSISAEPMLDNKAVELVADLEQYVTDAIWVGKANSLLKRVRMNGYDDAETIKRANELLQFQSDENVKKLYFQLCSNGKIKWKESIKKVVDLDRPTTIGLDI